MDPEFSELIRSEINLALNEKFGPLLLEIAKILKSVSNDLQQLNLASQNNFKNANLETSAATAQKGIDPEALRGVFQEELSNSYSQIANTIDSQFKRIDNTLGRFFQKTLTDATDMKKTLKTINSARLQFNKEGQNQGLVNTNLSKENRTELSPYLKKSALDPDYKDQLVPTARHLYSNQTARTLSTTKQIDKKPVTNSNTATYVKSTYAQDFDKQEDLDQTKKFISNLKKGNVSPRDALAKLEHIRDKILFERPEEPSYRGQVARGLREALSLIKMERGSRILSDDITNELVLILESLANAISS